eukprot:gene2395-225_t
MDRTAVKGWTSFSRGVTDRGAALTLRDRSRAQEATPLRHTIA